MNCFKMATGALLPKNVSDPLAALADLVPQCDLQPEITHGQHACPERAVWAVRTHFNPGSGTCPWVLLLCEAHLPYLQGVYRKIWKRLQKKRSSPLWCANCAVEIPDFDGLIWGIERIAP